MYIFCFAVMQVRLSFVHKELLLTYLLYQKYWSK